MLASASEWCFIIGDAFSIVGSEHWVRNSAQHWAMLVPPVVSKLTLQNELWSDTLCSHESCRKRANTQQPDPFELLAGFA